MFGFYVRDDEKVRKKNWTIDLRDSSLEAKEE